MRLYKYYLTIGAIFGGMWLITTLLNPTVYAAPNNVTNNVQTTTQSGTATVTGNENGGDATTGPTDTTVNIVNSDQSSSSLGDSGSQASTSNIDSDTNGNINVDPSNPSDQTTDVQVNSTDSGTINNNVTTDSTSGNATVEGNENAGSATSGDATSETNIVNLVNTTITASQSYIAVVNIYGNLNGNIVIPANVVSNPQSLPNHTDDGATVNNNVASSATSGNASTSVNIYNLINSTIVGKNLLLIFINVSGNWVGTFVNMNEADVQQNTQDQSTSENTINNNVIISATSGNATVENNGTAGDATSGNASTNVNIANLVNDDINLSGWFGIVIINIYGSWNGNIVPPTPPVVTQPPTTVVPPVTVQKSSTKKPIFFFGNNISNTQSSSTTPVTAVTASTNAPSESSTLDNFATIPINAHKVKKTAEFSGTLAVIGVVLAGIVILVERIVSTRIKPQA